MLGSITPLGERGRRQRWGVTAAWVLSGSVAGGVAIGAAAGAIGRVALRGPADMGEPLRLTLLAGLLAVGALMDAPVGPLRLPTVRRQVNEDWLTRYRGWVYGAAFGFQLGLGVVTIVSVSAVYLTVTAAVLAGGAAGGAVVGGAFGLLRAAP